MILIKRGTEPSSLLEFRLQNPNATYADTPSDVLGAIRKQMWEEQKCLCGYCMRRIKMPETVRIEHYESRHPQGDEERNPQTDLNFKIMIGVCYGNSGKGIKKENTTCDVHRENTKLTVDPFRVESIRKIKYKSDGRIYSDDPDIHKDVTETLNLNCEAVSLPQTRKKVLEKAIERIDEKCGRKSREAYVNELERTYEKLVRERNLVPYCGVIISWLEEKLKIS